MRQTKFGQFSSVDHQEPPSFLVQSDQENKPSNQARQSNGFERGFAFKDLAQK